MNRETLHITLTLPCCAAAAVPCCAVLCCAVCVGCCRLSDKRAQDVAITKALAFLADGLDYIR
jgi:hypothetical protein